MIGGLNRGRRSLLFGLSALGISLQGLQGLGLSPWLKANLRRSAPRCRRYATKSLRPRRKPPEPRRRLHRSDRQPKKAFPI